MAGSSTIQVVRPDNPIVGLVSGKPLVDVGNRSPEYSPRQRLQSNSTLVADVLNVVFWASLAREEGRPVCGGVAIASPEDTVEAFTFEAPISFTHANVVRLATVTGMRSRLLVHEENGAAIIWGLAAGVKGYCVTVVV